MKRLISFIAFVLPFTAVVAQEQPADTTGITFLECSYAEALQTAKKAGRLLFVDCYTQWCGPCKQLAKTTFKDPEVGELYNGSFVCLKLDMETPDGIAQKDKFGVTAYPTMVFVDPKTEEVVHKMVGYGGTQEFLRNTVAGLSGNNIKTMTDRYNAGEHSDAFMKEYFQVLAAASERDRLAALVPDYLDKKCDDMLTDKETFGYFMAYVNSPYAKPYVFFLDNKDKFARQYGEQVIALKESRTWNIYGRSFVVKNDDGSYTYDEKGMADYKKYMKSYKVKDIAKIELGAKMYYAECTGNWKDYIACGDKLIGKYDADALEVYNWLLRIDKNCTDPKLRRHAAVWCDKMVENIEAENARASQGSGMAAMRMGPQAKHFTELAEKLLKA